MTDRFPLDGACTCGRVRFRIETAPLIVHCCHCTWCQKETGSAFAVNAMIESERVSLVGDEPVQVPTPSASGAGQLIARCPKCHVAVWSHYAGSGAMVRFVRVGSLKQPHEIRPDIHIFTSTKRDWVLLPPDIPTVPDYYDRTRLWPRASLDRWSALQARTS